MEIIPGQSIGSFKIGDHFFDHPLFSDFKEVKEGRFQSGFTTVRVNKQGMIDLVATGNGKYKNISTYKTFRQIINEGVVLLYDDFDQVFYLKEPEGLCIGKAYENLNLEELLDSKIDYLNIYDVNADEQFFNRIKKDFEEISKDHLKKQENN